MININKLESMSVLTLDKPKIEGHSSRHILKKKCIFKDQNKI